MRSVTRTQQADAVERAVVNLRGLIARRKELLAKGRWPAADIEVREAHLRDLEAAAKTLRRLAELEP